MRGARPELMRRHNERLVLTLLRRNGPMARSELAVATGLSPQTASNITRDLLERGLLTAEDRVRGRVGQPTTPLALNPRGAFFLGLKIGRRSLEAVLADFLGTVVDRRMLDGDAPGPGTAVAFASTATREMLAGLAPEERARAEGIGIAAPFRLWDWGEAFLAWRERDLRAEVETATGLPAILENDASCACGAELLFGRRDLPRDFIYAYVGHFAGGGLVLDGQMRFGPARNAGALGSMPVPGGDGDGGGVVQLTDRASLSALEALAGRRLPLETAAWRLPAAAREAWLAAAADGIAFAALSGAALCDVEALLIDGHIAGGLRDALVARTQAALARLPGHGVALPRVLAGSLGPGARARGAASLPLARGYLLERAEPAPAADG